MTRALLLVPLLAGCPAPPLAVDAGIDAPPGDDAPVPVDAALPSDGGRDAPLPGRDAGPDAPRGDGGPDLGPGSCAMALDFDALATADGGGARTLSVDLASRGDHLLTTCSPAALGADAALRLTAPSAGRLVVETLGTADTILALRADCVEAVELSCNDDADRLSGPARVVADVTAGETLFVVLDTFAPGVTAVDVRVRMLPLRLAGEACDPSGVADACASGLLCAEGTGGPTCASPSAVGCDRPIDLDAFFDPTMRTALYRGTTAGAPDMLDVSCAPGSAPEIVHRFTMPWQGRVRIDLRGRLVGAVAVRSDCTSAASELACVARSVVLPDALGVLSAGSTIDVVVEGWDGEAGTYELELSLDRIVGDGAACTTFGRAIDLCDPTLSCRDGACAPLVCGDGLVESSVTTTEVCDLVANVDGDGCAADCLGYDDTCATPIELSTLGTWTGLDSVEYVGTNVGAGDDFRGRCTSSTTAGSSDRVLVFRPTRSGMVELSTEGTTYDTVLYARNDCLGADVQCNDDVMSRTYWSRILVPVTNGTPLYVIVDAYGAGQGTFHLTATYR
jgi:hypothetical protein